MKKNFTLSLISSPASAIKDEKKLTRYRKELIKVGKYVKDSVGLAFEVTQDTLVHWLDTFNQWIDNGNKVPIPLSHAAADKPEENQGWVRGMYIEDDALIGVLELADPALALTTDVSIYVPADFVDGSGHKYIQPITHVALCTNPVIPGLKDFQELSLSLGDNDMNTKKVAKLLGLEENADEAAITAAITKVIAAKAPDKATTKTLSHAGMTPASGPIVGLVVDNRGIKVSNLVKAGLITPAIETAIGEHYMKAETLALTLSGGWDDGFDFMVRILTENTPVALGERSGQQLLELANSRSQGEQDPIAKDVDKRRKAAGLDK